MSHHQKIEFVLYTTAGGASIVSILEATTWAEVVSELHGRGMNYAVVFKNKKLPAGYDGYPVINGDESDLRFLDKKGVVVGLYAKGHAKKSNSGFAVAA